VNALGELPVLDAARCTVCGDCVAVCPTRCLAMGGTRPWLPRPLDCISCTACALVCAPAAIRFQAAFERTTAG
jgi:formate hydrogenlyase subunit 6/NADH:ubiquinone oxidoreductase subunit I